MNRSIFVGIFASLLCVACFVGCKPDDGLNPVEGTVTLDGQPLASGHIDMGPMAGQSGTPTGGDIVNGAFKMRASEGEMVVSIRSQQVVELTPEEQTADEKAHGITSRQKELLPQKYNDRSELKTTIVKGKNTVTFDLKSDSAE